MPPLTAGLRARFAVALLLVTSLGLAPASLGAQADSLAAAARDHYRSAVAASRQGDVRATRDFLVRAHQAWPTQPAYLLAAAQQSARLADTAATARYLEALATLGAGLDLGAGEAFASVRDAATLAEARRRLAENSAPMVRSRVVATLPDSAFYPEGMDHDPRSDAWFVASIRKRTIVRIGPDGHARDFPRPGSERLDAVMGVRVDAERGVVWATTRAMPVMEGYRPEDGARARVWAFDLATGALKGMADVPGEGPHLLGDLVVHSSGTVYLTDSESPVLYRARLDGGRVVIEEAVRHRLFRSLQGLVFDRDGRRLVMADYSHGLLLVDPERGTVHELPAPAGVSTLGLDGLARLGDDIIGVQNGIAPPRIVRFRLDESRTRVLSLEVLDRHLPVADEPTIGALAGDRFVYVANSQWEKYDQQGSRRPGTELRSPVLLGVDLRP